MVRPLRLHLGCTLTHRPPSRRCIALCSLWQYLPHGRCIARRGAAPASRSPSRCSTPALNLNHNPNPNPNSNSNPNPNPSPNQVQHAGMLEACAADLWAVGLAVAVAEL